MRNNFLQLALNTDRSQFGWVFAFLLFGAIAFGPIGINECRAQEKKEAVDRNAELEGLELFNEVLEYIRKGEIRDGVEHMESRLAEKDDFDSVDVQRTYQLVISAFSRVRNGRQTYAQTEKLIAYQLERLDDEKVIGGMPGSCRLLSQAATRPDVNKINEATTILRSVVEKLEPLANYEKAEPPTLQLSEIKAILAQTLVRNNQREEAKAVCRNNYETLKPLYENNSDDEVAAAIYVRALSNMMRMAEGMEEPEALYKEHQEILKSRIETEPENASYVMAYVSALIYKTNSLLLRDAEAAEELADEGIAMLKRLSELNPSSGAAIQNQANNLLKMRAAAQSKVMIKKLKGQPATDFDAMLWVNGEEVELDDLKGNVVLLDFWAMWSAPCVKSLPELRRMTEEYGDKGLRIIGVTNYYNYGWDAENKRPQRAKEKMPEQEQDEAVTAFMEYHKVPYPSIINSNESTMNADYGVRGIPHMVVIDKKGNIREITVGAKQQKLAELEELIQELLDE